MREWTIVIRQSVQLYHILQELMEWTIIIRYVIFSESEGVDYNNPLYYIFRK